MKQDRKALSLKTLNKSNVWEVQENDIFRMWEAGEKEIDARENHRHYLDVIKSAFELEEVKVDKPEVIKKYEERGYKVGFMRMADGHKVKWAVKKRAITRITDLTADNIRHISSAKLLEVIERNFGGGWESMSQSVRNIIETAFDISTTTLPRERLHKTGGLYQKKVDDGYDVLEIEKGTWVEAIFAKAKPAIESPKIKMVETSISDDYEEDTDEDLPELEETENEDEDEDVFDEEQLVEESYRTTFDSDADELSLSDGNVTDDDDDSF